MIFKEFPFPFWIELVSFLISLILIKKLMSSSMTYLLFILSVNIIVEFIGMYLKYIDHKQTAWLYNLLTIIQFPLWILLFDKHISGTFMKRVAKIVILMFLLFAISNLFFIQGIRSFNNYTLILGSAILIFFCCVYLFLLLNSNYTKNPVSIPMFWVSSGAFFYFTGTFLYFAFYDYLMKYYARTGNEVFIYINLNLIIVLYVSISIGMLKTLTIK
jgi:hypothetical protein